MSDELDVIVVGAGVVGLACGMELAGRGHSTLVVERLGRAGESTSSRNSGVIHAGIYYPEGSLKAASCVLGRERIYRWCERFGVAHRRSGKVIVATCEHELHALQALHKQGVSAGAGSLELWTQRELQRREPTLRGAGALFSPDSGVIDAPSFLRTLQAQAKDSGCDLLLRTTVDGVERKNGWWSVSTSNTRGERHRVSAVWLVNAAGLQADRFAANAGIDIDRAGWRQRWVKGSYFTVRMAGDSPNRDLVYPAPARDGLGIHLTRNLGGQWLAGPDACPVETIDYHVDEARSDLFAASLARIYPRIVEASLRPDYAGIRPRLSAPGEFRDFILEESSDFGAPQMIHLVGIESPGLTASLDLAFRVANMVSSQAA